MNIDLIKDNVTPAEGEHSVRTYYCTYYQSKLLGLEAKGFLGVTNKRVIFQANGTSNAGNSVIQSELPISDVSGISCYKGTYFSLGHLLGAFLLTAIASGIVTAIIGAIGAMSRSSDGFLAIGWITAIGTVVGSFLTQRKSIWRSVLAGSSVSALTALGGGSLLNSFSFFGRVQPFRGLGVYSGSYSRNLRSGLRFLVCKTSNILSRNQFKWWVKYTD